MPDSEESVEGTQWREQIQRSDIYNWSQGFTGWQAYFQQCIQNCSSVCLLKWEQFKLTSLDIQIMQVIIMTQSQWLNECVCYHCVFSVTNIKEPNLGQSDDHSVTHPHKPLALCDRKCCCHTEIWQQTRRAWTTLLNQTRNLLRKACPIHVHS